MILLSQEAFQTQCLLNTGMLADLDPRFNDDLDLTEGPPVDYIQQLLDEEEPSPAVVASPGQPSPSEVVASPCHQPSPAEGASSPRHQPYPAKGAASPRQPSPAEGVASPRPQPSPAKGAASPRCQPSPAADDELGDDAMECFVSSLVDDHVSTMMSAGIGDAVRGCERQLRLKLRGAMRVLAGQLRILRNVFSSF